MKNKWKKRPRMAHFKQLIFNWTCLNQRHRLQRDVFQKCTVNARNTFVRKIVAQTFWKLAQSGHTVKMMAIPESGRCELRVSAGCRSTWRRRRDRWESLRRRSPPERGTSWRGLWDPWGSPETGASLRTLCGPRSARLEDNERSILFKEQL